MDEAARCIHTLPNKKLAVDLKTQAGESEGVEKHYHTIKSEKKTEVAILR